MTSNSFYFVKLPTAVRVLSGRSQVLLPLTFRSYHSQYWCPISSPCMSVPPLASFVPKPFGSEELEYFQEAQESCSTKNFKKPQNKLATTLINQKRKLSSRIGKIRQSRRKKESKGKVKKLKEKRLQRRAYLLLEKLTSREVAGEVFDAIKTNNSFTSIATINAELNGKLVRRLHLDPLLWLLEKGVFNKNITRTLQVVVAEFKRKKH